MLDQLPIVDSAQKAEMSANGTMEKPALTSVQRPTPSMLCVS